MKQNYITYKLQAREQTKGSHFRCRKFGPSLFFSGKLQNYSEARQRLRLRLSNVFHQKSVAVYNMLSRPFPEFPCGHSRNIAIIRYGQLRVKARSTTVRLLYKTEMKLSLLYTWQLSTETPAWNEFQDSFRRQTQIPLGIHLSRNHEPREMTLHWNPVHLSEMKIRNTSDQDISTI